MQNVLNWKQIWQAGQKHDTNAKKVFACTLTEKGNIKAALKPQFSGVQF